MKVSGVDGPGKRRTTIQFKKSLDVKQLPLSKSVQFIRHPSSDSQGLQEIQLHVSRYKRQTGVTLKTQLTSSESNTQQNLQNNNNNNNTNNNNPSESIIFKDQSQQQQQFCNQTQSFSHLMDEQRCGIASKSPTFFPLNSQKCLSSPKNFTESISSNISLELRSFPNETQNVDIPQIRTPKMIKQQGEQKKVNDQMNSPQHTI